MGYDEEVIKYFFENQGQLFDQPVAENLEEAGYFLEDCMAVVLDKVSELRDYLDEMGMDVTGMTKEELLDQAEVFTLPDGRFLLVEG